MRSFADWLLKRDGHRPDPAQEKRRLIFQELEGKRLEAKAKKEIATGYTAAGFPEAAEEMEHRVSRLEAEVERMRRRLEREIVEDANRGYGLDRL